MAHINLMHFRPIRASIVAAVGIWFALAPRPAEACDPDSPRPHEIDWDEAEVDETPPDAVTDFRHGVIKRGFDEECQAASSCDDIGWLDFTIEPPDDDRTASDEMGYFFEVTDGELVRDLRLATREEPVRAFGSTLPYTWVDGATDVQEPFDFTVVVYAVDLGGNVSLPSEPLRVEHAGRTSTIPSECANDEASGLACRIPETRPPASPTPLLALLVAAALRRRRHRPPIARSKSPPGLPTRTALQPHPSPPPPPSMD